MANIKRQLQSFSQDEKSCLLQAIREYGLGMHPWPENWMALAYFAPGYARECLRRACDAPQPPANAKTIMRGMMGKL